MADVTTDFDSTARAATNVDYGADEFASGANLPPSVSLTSPTNGQSFTPPASITINASASDGDGTVAKVEFYQGATKLGEDTTSPYSYSWTGVAAGSYTLTAIATDNSGATTTSAGVGINVNAGGGGGTSPLDTGGSMPPTVAILTPATNVVIAPGGSVNFTGSATDSDGTVTSYRWTFDGVRADMTVQNPGSVTFPAAGSYHIYFMATDNTGTMNVTSCWVFVSGTGSAVQPTALTANQRAGQTILTWAENTAISGERYRIYRHTSPITSANISSAIPLAEVAENSGNYRAEQGNGSSGASPIGQTRFIVQDKVARDTNGLGTQVGATTGVFVHTIKNATPGTYYYAVTTIDSAGAENRTTFGSGNSLAAGLAEVKAIPTPVHVYTGNWNDGYGGNYRNYVYTLFMDYEEWNPKYIGYAFNFTVTVPLAYDPAGTRVYPIIMNIEGWGSRYGMQSWNANSIFVSADEPFQTWYFGFGGNRDTSTYRSGFVANYMEKYIIEAILAVQRDTYYKTDPKRVYIYGHSMGGSGCLALGMRYPKLFAANYCSEPMTNFAASTMWVSDVTPKWGGTTNGGDPIINLPLSDPQHNLLQRYNGTPVFNWQNHQLNMQKRVADEMTYIETAHGTADTTIDWSTQGAPWYTLMGGSTHGGRGWAGFTNGSGHSWMAWNGMNLTMISTTGNAWDEWVFRKDSAMPGISNVAWDNTHSGRLTWSAAGYSGLPAPVDQAARFEMTIKCSSATLVASVTPRRLQQFVVTPAANYDWQNVQGGTTIASGTVAAAANGLITVPNFTITPTGNRLILVPAAGGNTAPTITNVSDHSISEDANTGAIAFTVGDAETAASALIVTGTSSNTTLVPHANVVFSGSGANRTVTVTPAANQNGSATITVTVSDGSLTASDTFVLTVTAVNDAPVLNALSNVSIGEDAGLQTISLAGIGDGDPELSQTLTVTATSSNSALIPNPAVTYTSPNPTGSLTFTPSANASGTASVTVTVTDNGSGTAPNVNTFIRQFTVTVTAVNDAPTVSNIADRTINEDANTGAVAFTVGDVETAATALTVTTASSNITLVPSANIVLGGSGANRTVTVTPTANQSGSATITVTVSDGTLTASDTFVLTVTAVNDAPTISNIADQTINQNGNTGALAFTIGDIETAAASLTVTTASSNTTLVPNANIVLGGSGANRTVTVTPAANQSGTATITVSVSDGGLSANDNFVLTVNALSNTAPTISNIADRTINEDANTGAVAFTVGDAETAVTSLTVSTSSSNTTLVPTANIVLGGSGANRTVTVTPAGNQSGAATITVTVSDGSLSTSDTFVLTVTAVNDAPTISNIADRTINEDANTGAVAFTIGDIETAAASLTVTTASSNTTLVPNATIVLGGSGANRTVTVTPAANQSGAATITVTVSDGALTTSDTFVLTVAAVNDAPTISNIADQTINQNGNTGALAFTIGDIETAATSLTVTTASSNTTLVPSANIVLGGSGANRTVTVTPAVNQSGSATITVTASDGTLTASDTFVLKAIAGPAISTHPASIAVITGQTATFSVSATGAAPLAYQWQRSTTGGTSWSNVGANSASYTSPATVAGDSGSQFRCVVSNAAGSATSNAATLTVNLPAVSLAASDPSAAETGGNVGTFTLTRNGGTAASLTVQWAIGGSATNGSDYVTLGTSVVIPAGSATATVTVTPVDDAVFEGSESVVVSLVGDPAYTFVAGTSATVTLADNDTFQPGSEMTLTPTQPVGGQSVQITLNTNAQNASDVTYAWNFGDGTSGSGASIPSHVYAAPGDYILTVSATHTPTGQVTSSTTSVHVSSPLNLKINFQLATSPTPAGFLPDSGAIFGDRGNGYRYGWNSDVSSVARDRNAANSPDQSYDTLIHMQKPVQPNAVWEIALPNGNYSVRIVSGDPSYFDSVYQVQAEGVLVVSGTPTTTRRWFEGTQSVSVADGRLTVGNAAGSTNNKVCFIEITQTFVAGREVAASMDAEPMEILKLAVAANFARTGKDSFQVTGRLLTLEPGFAPAGQTASVDVGAAIVNLVLDSKGRGRSKQGNFQMKYSAKTGWVFSARLKGGAWSDEWSDGGVENATVPSAKVDLPVTLTLGTRPFGGGKSCLYQSKIGKTASAK